MVRKKKKKLATKKKATKRRAIKRKPARKRVYKRRPVKKVKPVKKIEGTVIGEVTHYFPKVRAAVVKLKATLSTGDTVKIKGHTTDFQQTVTSMQINHVPVNQAKKGEEIGLLVDSRVRQHDTVYKL